MIEGSSGSHYVLSMMSMLQDSDGAGRSLISADARGLPTVCLGRIMPVTRPKSTGYSAVSLHRIKRSAWMFLFSR